MTKDQKQEGSIINYQGMQNEALLIEREEKNISPLKIMREK